MVAEELTPEQKAELAEAVEAEQKFRELPKIYESIMNPKDGLVTSLHKQIIALLGRESVGSAAYCRNKAIEKLEECVHRIHDGMSAIQHREQAELEAFTKASVNGKVITMKQGGA